MKVKSNFKPDFTLVMLKPKPGKIRPKYQTSVEHITHTHTRDSFPIIDLLPSQSRDKNRQSTQNLFQHQKGFMRIEMYEFLYASDSVLRHLPLKRFNEPIA